MRHTNAEGSYLLNQQQEQQQQQQQKRLGESARIFFVLTDQTLVFTSGRIRDCSL